MSEVISLSDRKAAVEKKTAEEDASGAENIIKFVTSALSGPNAVLTFSYSNSTDKDGDEKIEVQFCGRLPDKLSDLATFKHYISFYLDSLVNNAILHE